MNPTHKIWIYAIPFSSEYPFLDVHRSNALESNLMFVYVLRSYVHIASTSKHVVTKEKEIAAKSFSKILGISVNILLQRLVPEALKIEFFKVKYISQVSDFYIKLTAKLVKFLRYWKNLYRNWILLTLKGNYFEFCDTAENLQSNCQKYDHRNY